MTALRVERRYPTCPTEAWAASWPKADLHTDGGVLLRCCGPAVMPWGDSRSAVEKWVFEADLCRTLAVLGRDPVSGYLMRGRMLSCIYTAEWIVVLTRGTHRTYNGIC